MACAVHWWNPAARADGCDTPEVDVEARMAALGFEPDVETAIDRAWAIAVDQQRRAIERWMFPHE